VNVVSVSAGRPRSAAHAASVSMSALPRPRRAWPGRDLLDVRVPVDDLGDEVRHRAAVGLVDRQLRHRTRVVVGDRGHADVAEEAPGVDFDVDQGGQVVGSRAIFSTSSTTKSSARCGSRTRAGR
jgi:hypothetical protein